MYGFAAGYGRIIAERGLISCGRSSVATTWPRNGEGAQLVVAGMGTVPPRRTALEFPTMLCGAMAKAAAGRRGLAGRFGVSPRSNPGWAARSMNVAWIRSPGLGVIREARSPDRGGIASACFQDPSGARSWPRSTRRPNREAIDWLRHSDRVRCRSARFARPSNCPRDENVRSRPHAHKGPQPRGLGWRTA